MDVVFVDCTFNVQGIVKNINPKNNTSILTWTDIVPNSGVINISAIGQDNSPTLTYAYLNVLEIIQNNS